VCVAASILLAAGVFSGVLVIMSAAIVALVDEDAQFR
jgi:hypothetical protein